MKKILMILLFTSGLYGQQKTPSKEETIRFMEMVLKSIEGKTIGDYPTTFLEVTFDGSSYLETVSYNGQAPVKETYNNIKWDSYMGVASEEKVNGRFTTIYPRFDKNIKVMSDEGKISFTGNLILNIATEQLSSFKKAMTRLAEIAKEENKDPFKE